MRLEKIQEFLKTRQMPYTYWEENRCGSIDFLHKGLSYHIWEYPDSGANSNVRTTGRSEDFDGDYEERILEILRTW